VNPEDLTAEDLMAGMDLAVRLRNMETLISYLSARLDTLNLQLLRIEARLDTLNLQLRIENAPHPQQPVVPNTTYPGGTFC
jgi:hypothetical protein